MERMDDIEISIVKKFNRSIWSKFIKGIKTYQLVESGDKIAVCISGGKDSMLMARCFMRLIKYSDVPFELRFIVMDPGYNAENRQRIIENAEKLSIPIEIFESNIFRVVEKEDCNPCYLCARMRRGNLYSYAKSIGCNKIALGHHYDDIIETILMGMLYGSQMQTMMPKLHSDNFEGMELIRPLYLVREADIISWAKYNGLEFIRCACKATKDMKSADDEGGTKRQEIKLLIRKLKETNPNVEKNIFRSAENVNLKTIISYHQGDKYHHFLDDYHANDGKGESHE